MINKNDKLVIFLEEVLGVDVDFDRNVSYGGRKPHLFLPL